MISLSPRGRRSGCGRPCPGGRAGDSKPKNQQERKMNTPTPIPTQLPGGIDGTGVYHTPKAAIDAVLANPPLSDAPGGARPVAT